MDKLEQKLKVIQELIKAQEVPPSPKPPRAPEPTSPDAMKPPEAPKAGQATSKKDPKKMAEQLKEPDAKNQAMKDAQKLKEGVKFNSGGQWSISKAGDREELQKGIKNKLAGLAVAGSALMGGAQQAQADVGHLKGYLKSMHGMELGGHTVSVHHKDTTRDELKGSSAGSGKFRIKVGDFHIDGSYSGINGEHSKIKLSKPYHHKMGHQPYEGEGTQYLDDKAAAEAESLHGYLSGTSGESDSHKLSLHHHLQRERKSGDKRGLDIGDFNVKKTDDLDKIFPVPTSP